MKITVFLSEKNSNQTLIHRNIIKSYIKDSFYVLVGNEMTHRYAINNVYRIIEEQQ